MPEAQPSPHSRPSSLAKKIVVVLLSVSVIFFGVAYILMPADWLIYAKRHPLLDSVPTITETGADIPGDPLNVAIIGTEIELKKIIIAAKWYPSDPLTLKSCLEIAVATVLKRPYDEAPVSDLYLFGRKQDLAFEKPVGDNPRKRQHVRFWLTKKTTDDGRPVWVGSATYDDRVGFSHTTGQFTHHIGADIDEERDRLMRDLRDTGELADSYFIDNFQKIREGRNGGGDPWRTDGRLEVGVIKQAAKAAP